MKFKSVPLTQKEANAYIIEHHRHHGATQGDKFRVGASIGGKLIGVVQVGRPVARNLDDGKTVEVLRLCTDGTRDCCSFLYSKAARIAKEMGYERIITYILSTENGASLRASGWKETAITSGGSWSRPSRERIDKAPTIPKKRFEKNLLEVTQ